MRLKPFGVDEPEDKIIDLSKEMTSLFSQGGRKSAKVEMDEIRGIFDEEQASIKEAAKTASLVMRAGESDGAKLRAAELILKVHGILQEENNKPSAPAINISIIGDGNNTMVNFLCPSPQR